MAGIQMDWNTGSDISLTQKVPAGHNLLNLNACGSHRDDEDLIVSWKKGRGLFDTCLWMLHSRSSVPQMFLVLLVPEQLDEFFDGGLKHFSHHFTCILNSFTQNYPQVSPCVKSSNYTSEK